MLVINKLTDAKRIDDLEIRHLVEKRIHDLSLEPYDPEVRGYFLVIEPGDSTREIDAQLGFSILGNRWNGTCFGEADFTPSFEVVEEHFGFFDMVFVISDDGYGVEVFVPKSSGIDSTLLAMCQQYAIPAQLPLKP